MTSKDFCYWLQGFFELHNAGLDKNCKSVPVLDGAKVDCIMRHLSMVFKHEIDPSYGDKPEQDALNHLHNNKPGGGPLIRC